MWRLALEFLVQAQLILVTGLYDAQLDHSPVLALTGMVPRKLIGQGAIQEIDQQAFFEPLTVYNKTLMTEDQTTTLATLAINMRC